MSKSASGKLGSVGDVCGSSHITRGAILSSRGHKPGPRSLVPAFTGAAIMTVNSEPQLRKLLPLMAGKKRVGDISYRNWQEGCQTGGEHSCDSGRTWNLTRQRFSNCVHMKVLSLYKEKCQHFPLFQRMVLCRNKSSTFRVNTF